MAVRSNRIVALTIAVGMLGGLTLLGTTAWGQPDKGQQERQPGQPGGPGRGGQAPSVEGSMKQMNGAMRRLRDQIGDASKKEDNLRLIGDMQRGAVSAKNGKPKKLNDVKDEGERAKKAEKFRRDLITLTRKLLDIEQNILDGKNDVAKTQLEEVMKQRDEEHKYFGVDDED
jgi:hypothetical protein